MYLAHGGQAHWATGHDIPRIMFYCDDEAQGYGHLRRTLTVAQYLASYWPSLRQLIVTGSPIPADLPIPSGADYIKLPAVARLGSEQLSARTLPISFNDMLDLRRDMLFSAARYFKPDVLMVDHTPPGLKEEIVPTLRYLRDTSATTRLILGLRDIVGDPGMVRASWARDDVIGLIEHTYDQVLVYGYREIHDVTTQYGFSQLAASKTRYVGYLRREAGTRPPESIRAELGLSKERLVLVAAGEGDDSYDLFRTVLDAARLHAERELPYGFVLVGGPPLSETHRRNLSRLLPCVRFKRRVDDLRDYIGAADVVVSRAGYNTVCEILSLGRRTILVPRTQPSHEELNRAQALRNYGLVDMIQPADLTAARLLQKLNTLLNEPTETHITLTLDGLPHVASLIQEMVSPLPSNTGVHNVLTKVGTGAA
jgi:predicted glycosyltransferase